MHAGREHEPAQGGKEEAGALAHVAHSTRSIDGKAFGRCSPSPRQGRIIEPQHKRERAGGRQLEPVAGLQVAGEHDREPALRIAEDLGGREAAPIEFEERGIRS